MITREVQIRVSYRDTDAMGVVYHANYVSFAEVARTEMLRSMGMTYRQMELDGVMLPVIDLGMSYLSPAFYDDLLTIKITMKETPRAKITFHHEIFNEQGTLLNKGYITLAFVNTETRRPCRAPKEFLALLEKNF